MDPLDDGLDEDGIDWSGIDSFDLDCPTCGEEMADDGVCENQDCPDFEDELGEDELGLSPPMSDRQARQYERKQMGLGQ